MANCLYSGDKPLGIVQSNAEDVAYDSNTSVKEKIDEIDTMELLATANAQSTGFDLSHPLTDYKKIIFTSYLSQYVLASIELRINEISIGNTNIIVCSNDGTVRKGQLTITSANKVTSTSNWSNIDGIYVYGIK